MKFGRYLEDTQIPEWKKAYIDYHALKKRIKDIIRAQSEHEPLLTEELARSPVASTSGVQLAGAVRRDDPFGPSGAHRGFGTYGSTDRLESLRGKASMTSVSPRLTPDEEASSGAPIVVLPEPAHVEAPEGEEALQVDELLSRPTLRLVGMNMRAYSDTSIRVPRRSQTEAPHSEHSLRQTGSNSSSRGSALSRDQASKRGPMLRTKSTWLMRKPSQRLPTSVPLADLLPTLSPVQRAFFDALDRELEKVEKFYSEREREATIKLATLKEQLRELQEHRTLYHQAQDAEQRRSYVGAFVAVLDKWHIPYPRANDEDEEDDRIRPGSPTAAISNGNGKSSGDGIDSGKAIGKSPSIPLPATLKSSLKHKVNNTTSALSHHTRSHSRSIRRDPDEYVHAKKKLKKALLEYHRGVELLNDYRILNITGFKKALKKFEKVTHIPASEAYTKEKVEPSSFSSSQTLERIIQESEELYAKSFERGDIKKARTRLRTPWQQRSKHHFSTFRSGLFLGLAVPMLVDGIYKSFQPETRAAIPYWGELLYAYAVFLVPCVFALLIGVNIVVWSSARINYQFIFELDVRTQIDAREYFELPSLITATLCYALWFSFARVGAPTISPTVWLVVWIVFTGVIVFDPLPIYFKPSRYWLTRVVGKLFVSGTRRVEFTDFWMGDQMCSLPFTLANLYFVGCAYSVGWVNVWPSCSTSPHNWGIFAALAILPSAIRLVQSIKRWVDSRLITHLINAGKYGSSMLFYLLYYNWRSRGSVRSASVSFIVWILSGIFYSCYTSSWDLWMDWSVLRPHAKHRFLRNDLVYTDVIPLYYFAIISNIVIRFGWLIYLVQGPNTAILSFIAASLEMLRRCQWNFFRLENEHLGNTDQYRVTREVPLPYKFNEAGEDSDTSERSKKSWVQQLRERNSSRNVHLTEMEGDGRMSWKCHSREEEV